METPPSQLDTMSLLDDARITHKLDQRIIEAVNNLDLSKQRADSLLCEISNIGINENALHSLIDDTWLRQDVIDAFCLLFEAEFPDAAFFGPAFTRKLLGKKVGGHVNSTDPNSVQCNWNDVSRQMARNWDKGKNYADKKAWFFFINVSSSHWAMVKVSDPIGHGGAMSIQWVDSLNNKVHGNAYTTVIADFIWMAYFYNAKFEKIQCRPEHAVAHVERFTQICQTTPSAQQDVTTDPNSCGIYMLMNTKLLCHQHAGDFPLGLLNSLNITHFRSTLAIDLIMGKEGPHDRDMVLNKLSLIHDKIKDKPPESPTPHMPVLTSPAGPSPESINTTSDLANSGNRAEVQYDRRFGLGPPTSSGSGTKRSWEVMQGGTDKVTVSTPIRQKRQKLKPDTKAAAKTATTAKKAALGPSFRTYNSSSQPEARANRQAARGGIKRSSRSQTESATIMRETPQQSFDRYFKNGWLPAEFLATPIDGKVPASGQEAPTSHAAVNAHVSHPPLAADALLTTPCPSPPTSTLDESGADIHIVTNPPSFSTSADTRSRDASSDDVHSLAGNGSDRINLFHKEDKDPFRPA